MLKRIAQVFTIEMAAFGLATSKAFATQDIGSVNENVAPFSDLGVLIGNVVAVILFLAGLLAFIFLLIGGLQWITSGGDKAAASAARDRITASLVGLIIVVAAFAIVLVLENVFGIRILRGVDLPGATRTVGA